MKSMEIYPYHEDMNGRKKRKHRSNGCLRRNQPDSLALKMEDVATSQNMMAASGIWNEEISPWRLSKNPVLLIHCF